MNKLNRERKAFIDGMGLDFLRIEIRGKHVAFVCTEGRIFCGTTPSDWRESRKFRSYVRRLARGLSTPLLKKGVKGPRETQDEGRPPHDKICSADYQKMPALRH